MSDFDKRINDLEIKFTHQDDLVEQLNKIVASQQFIIEELKRDILELKRLHAEHEVSANRTLKDDIPPHY